MFMVQSLLQSQIVGMTINVTPINITLQLIQQSDFVPFIMECLMIRLD